ncbi:hypothetical protein [Cryptosporidium parvum Iowa II]|uniref:Uncharacterized protein n=2 Tax=Cryptosporidium parvum TaxID=5807 RepID=Q5CWA3_CRYPI|nr:hypothetical protein [Cryptosporidium parvum Iowa II]EAK89331.1 hypothetical protein cgd8_1090 [Cryptosporidium parvum Iowa II]QOY39859.1 Uncharacterized protein CPATCC_0001130 [Cryptosporidium parvum]WKS79357.1 hypothetical protein CPCDC_8g1090 [Cryptosporidium sp. 43IA8]WRK33855.1 Uncharacterized protein cpbgf_8001090 [Cryptosporidium parvum]|eukprot:QOY39859.1 hypothetical protein CPATCC_003913 [Cryptosporidium parvum]
MGRKSSDGSGMGADILHALGFNKTSNSDNSDTADNKSKGQTKLGRLKFPKNKKKSKKHNIEVDSAKFSTEIDLKANDNSEIEQASEKPTNSSLMDVQLSFEGVLTELEKSLENIKKNVDHAESCLENIYISVDKLEKFSELCKVENKDVILGLHKLVNVHKGAALLSTFSSDPTFKKNCDYNVSDESKSAEKRLESKRSGDTNVVESEHESNVATVIETHNSNNSETKPAFVKSNSKTYNVKNSLSNNVFNKTEMVTPSKSNNNFNSESPSAKSTMKSEPINKELEITKDVNASYSDKNNSEKSPKEGKISKTEKFKEKLNLKMRKKKDSTHESNDPDSADAENSTGIQTRMERFKKKFDRKSK